MAQKKVALKIVEPTDRSKEKKEKDSDEKKHHFSGGGKGRPLWNGSISFGLVNVPVHLVPATKNNDLHFHLLHDKDNARLKRKYVCSVDGKDVPSDEIRKGYEVSKDRHVIMDEEELKALAPKASRTIELLYFVHLADIDPIYYESPYYLLPAPNAEKPYALLRAAMADSGRAAISEIIMRGKEYLAAIRPIDNVLALDTMRFPAEVIFPAQLPYKEPAAQISDRELKAAKDLIESLDGKFEPKKLHDDYHELVLKAIERKAKGNKIVATPQQGGEEESTDVVDLMAALEKSLKQQNQKKTKAIA